MDVNYHGQQTVQFRVLAERQIERIYQATLECLNRTGVNVFNAEARELLAGAGARVEGVRVRIPAHLVQDAVAANPRSFTLWGRPAGGAEADGRPASQRRLQIVPDRVYFGPGLTSTYFVDSETGERRKSRQGDPGLTARVGDALENIDYLMGLGLIDDVSPELAPVYEFAEMVANTGKPVIAWAYSVENLAAMYEMALAVAGDAAAFGRRPFFALYAALQPPLQHPEAVLARALWAATHDIPVVYVSGGIAGVTAPITGAGLLVSALAGALSGLAIIQLKRQGAAVCLGIVPPPMDLRSGRPAFGGPEMSLYSAAMADICRYLGLPMMGTAGASEAKVLDLQAAIESTIQVVLSGLSGATLVHDLGFLDCADIGSLEALVMNDEIVAMTRRIMRGIEVSDEALMLDLIDEVGPEGEFITAEETARRCRTEIWQPSLMDRQPWEEWEAAGAQTMQARIKARLGKILANHEPPPLPQGAAERIAAILTAAEARASEA